MTDLAYQNQLAAATGGRSYLTVPRETDAERARRLDREAIARLAAKLKLVEQSSPGIGHRVVPRERQTHRLCAKCQRHMRMTKDDSPYCIRCR